MSYLSLLAVAMAVIIGGAGCTTPTVYVLFDDGGEHPVESCSVATDVPQDLSTRAELQSVSGYLGSTQVEFAEENEAGIDAYQHFFTDDANCHAAMEMLGQEHR
jgi:hypothetical protein